MKRGSSDERVVILAVIAAAVCCGLGPILLGAVGIGAFGLARGTGVVVPALVAGALAAAGWALHRRISSRRDRR